MPKYLFGSGPANPNWKGGRVTDPRGYVLILVGKDHPLADVRGYAYEHRLIAEQAAGRPLKPGEEVHHADEERGNNAPGNLDIEPSRAHHRKRHRSPRNMSRLRDPCAPNPSVQCRCGCGASFPKFDNSGRPRAWVSGHNLEGGQLDYGREL